MNAHVRYVWQTAATLVTALLVVLVAVFLRAWSGVYSVAASRGHFKFVEWFLTFGMRNSVELHARMIGSPPALDGPDLYILGAGHYHHPPATMEGRHCSGHGNRSHHGTDRTAAERGSDRGGDRLFLEPFSPNRECSVNSGQNSFMPVEPFVAIACSFQGRLTESWFGRNEMASEPNFHLFRIARFLACAAFCILQLSSASKAVDVAWQPLARMTVENMPPAPLSLAVTRMTYDAGPTRSRQNWPGPTLGYVESGSLEIEATAPLAVRRGTPDSSGRSEHLDPRTPVTLNAGDSVFIAQNTDTDIRNLRAEPVNLVVTAIGQVDQNAPPSSNLDKAEGMAKTRLAYALARSVPADPVVIEVGRLTLAPGAKVSSESAPGVAGDRAGPEVTVIDSGTFGSKVGTGEINIFRKEVPSDGRGETAPVQRENSLRPGDAMLSQTGSLDVLWNPAKIPATALLVRLRPAKAQP